MQVRQHPISTPHASVAYQLSSFHFGIDAASSRSGKKVYIQAALHADEVPGMLVSQVLRRELLALEAAGKIHGEIILVPAANPIGLAQAIHGAPFGRFDLSTGINFNRAYRHVADELKTTLDGQLGPDTAANVALIRQQARASVASWEPRTDAETLKKTLLGMAIDADIVLDLHCDNEAALHLYTGTPLAAQLAPLTALLGARAVLLELAAGEEPFDEACSRLWWDLDAHFQGRYPIPAACLSVTVELRGEVQVDYGLAERDANALLRFLAIEGVLDIPGAADDLPAPQCVPTPLAGVEPILAPYAGVLVYLREMGDTLAAGDAVADLIDPVSGDTTTLRCTVAGVFFARSAHRHVLRGMNVGKVAGSVAYRGGSLLSQ